MSTYIVRPGILGEAKSVLRFYDSELKRNSNRKACQGTCEYNLLCPNDHLLPFTISRTYTLSDITSFSIVDLDGNVVMNINTSLLTVRNFTIGSLVYYNGDALPGLLESGDYYCLVIDDTGQRWYSEKFHVVCYSLEEDLVINGSFDTISNWDSNIAIDTVNFCMDNLGTVTELSQNCLSFGNCFYQIKFDISNYNDGGLLIAFGATGDVIELLDEALDVAPPLKNIHNGTNTIVGYCVDPGDLTFMFSNNFTGCIDNVSAKRIHLTYSECHSRITWTNSCGMIGNQYYKDGFTNEFWFDAETELDELEPKYTEVLVQNGDRDANRQFIKRINDHRIAIGMIPKFLVDALAEIPLHDTVMLYLANDQGSEQLILPSFSANWEEVGLMCFAEADLTFQLPDSAVNSSCCDPAFEMDCRELNCDPELDDWDSYIEINTFGNYNPDIEPTWSISTLSGPDRDQLCLEDGAPGETATFAIPLEIGKWYRIVIDNYVNTFGNPKVQVMLGSINIGELVAGQNVFKGLAVDSSDLSFMATDTGICCFELTALQIFSNCYYDLIDSFTDEPYTMHLVPLDGGGMEYDGSGSDPGLLPNIQLANDRICTITIEISGWTGPGSLDVALFSFGAYTLLNLGLITGNGTYEFTFDPRFHTLLNYPMQFHIAPYTSPGSFTNESTFTIVSITINGCTFET